ncbi:MAG TPA: hypothetical protein VFM33_10080 [Aquabacterium sp.]|nr:hypothetical protein [Aquabacterium sp.]
MTTQQDTSTERDLVARLRDGVYGMNRIALCAEAADEIERLRAALASRDEAAQQPQGQAVSDAGDEAAHECLSVLAGIDTYEVNLCDHPDAYKALDGYTRAILALRPDHFPDAAKMMQASDGAWEVRISGPDDVLTLDAEIDALRQANEINKAFVADCLKNPDDHVLCVATVNGITAKEQGNEN